MDQQTTKNRKCFCRFCDETFTSQKALERHVSRHKKRLVCFVCGRLFEKKYTLAMHLKKYADEVPYECDKCDKKFHIESRRDAHLLIHSDENPFACKTCGKHFTHKHALSRHHETHVGQKPFKCKVCKKSFSQKGNMKRHVLTHIGIKPFFCEVCGKEFSQRGHLNVHRLIHDGRKPFACDICGEQFSTRRTFKGHYNMCKDKSGGSVEVIKFLHRSADRKSKSITISVGDRILGYVDIECKVNVFSESASNKHSNERRGAIEQLSEVNFSDSDFNVASDKSSRTNTKLCFSESDFSDFALNASSKSYNKGRKFCLSEIESLDSATAETTLCSTNSTEVHSAKGKIRNIFNSNNEAVTEIDEINFTEFDDKTMGNEAPCESYKANGSELSPSDGKALYFIKLSRDDSQRTREMNTSEFYIAEGKSQHCIKLTNETTKEKVSFPFLKSLHLS